MNTIIRKTFAAAMLALVVAPALAAAPGQGDAAPNYIGITLDREQVLLEKHAGSLVVLSFWATWCPYCLKELPILSGIRQASKGRIQVIAVNTEGRQVFRKVVGIMCPLDLEPTYDPDEKARPRQVR